jgi:hypothetical protein
VLGVARSVPFQYRVASGDAGRLAAE